MFPGLCLTERWTQSVFGVDSIDVSEPRPNTLSVAAHMTEWSQSALRYNRLNCPDDSKIYNQLRQTINDKDDCKL